MEESKTNTPGTTLPEEQVKDVSGGDGDCSSTTSIGGVTSPSNSFGQALIDTYEGVVDAASHVIERVL